MAATHSTKQTNERSRQIHSHPGTTRLYESCGNQNFVSRVSEPLRTHPQTPLRDCPPSPSWAPSLRLLHHKGMRARSGTESIERAFMPWQDIWLYQVNSR
jgi:hypothetical protein